MQDGSLFKGKVLCGPMVRISTLGFRLLCAKNGADVVYSEEIIANKLCKCVREVRRISRDEFKDFLPDNNIDNQSNTVIDLIEFVHYDCRQKEQGRRAVVFSTLSIGEGAKVIVQIGAASADIALAAAKVVQADVDGIELNMGCPKKFSTGQGMGAALMSKPDLAVSILSALVQGQSLPVSVKTRCMQSTTESVNLIRALDKSGVHAIVLHARQKEHRYTIAASYAEFRCIRVMLGTELRSSLILNGDVSSGDSVSDLMERTQCDGIMVCRSAMHDPSIFQDLLNNDMQAPHRTPESNITLPLNNKGIPRILSTVRTFVEWRAAFGACFQQIKYHALRVLQEYPEVHEQYELSLKAKDQRKLLSSFLGQDEPLAELLH
ncbi:tRNA-dihydrouridine synthase 2 [Perkinsela sp. CCAP 1560/4]|nr:tRNA-dihydrouridine synthase 2 [Perkinsela sp. CCAP 1560/4]|eukprot:KNH09264.1 tRNA-dihydrouridine synthase 2 [Perkinsela sp. CCAP 1560/4]